MISVYSILAIEFFARYLKRRPIGGSSRDPSDELTERGALDTRLKLMLFALCFNTFCLFIRYVLDSCPTMKYSLNIIRYVVLYTVLLNSQMAGPAMSFPLKSISVRLQSQLDLHLLI